MVSIDTPIRGTVYLADIGYGPVEWLVVSNNARNARLPDILCVRITKARRELPAWVDLGVVEPAEGWVDCDGITFIGKDQLGAEVGTLSGETMTRVAQALRHALAI